jgi:metal-responsive CopG/Arc/MetJ family transcriptional regulator
LAEERLMTATLETTSVTIPRSLAEEVDQLAALEGRSRGALIEDAIRQWISDRRWRAIQAEVSARAQELGLTEDDIEDLVDSVSE